MEEKPTEMDSAEGKVVEDSEKMECDEVLSGSETVEFTDSSDKTIGTEKKASLVASESSGIEIGSRSETTPTEIPCEVGAVSDVVAKVEDEAAKVEDDATVSTGMSPPAKRTLLSNIKEFFSPPKDKSGSKSKSRSKSMSPSEKNRKVKYSITTEEACAASEGEEEHLKKGGEKGGVMHTLRKQLTKMITRSKSSGSSESTNLVSDEETEGCTVVSKPPENQPVVVEGARKLQWTENRQSLTEKPSLDLTTTTDIPSTCSGADVFPSDSPSKHSETGEDTSEGAVVSSLVSSPDEKISDIQENKDAENECLKEGSPSDEEKVAETENAPDKHSLDKNAEIQENKDDANP